jgi:hypothetical protein
MNAYTGDVIRAFRDMLITFNFTFDNHSQMSSEILSSYVYLLISYVCTDIQANS